jgi:hypothetical protein
VRYMRRASNYKDTVPSEPFQNVLRTMGRTVITKQNRWFVCASVEITVCGDSGDEDFVHIIFENCFYDIRRGRDFDFGFNYLSHSRVKYLSNMRVCRNEPWVIRMTSGSNITNQCLILNLVIHGIVQIMILRPLMYHQ